MKRFVLCMGVFLVLFGYSYEIYAAGVPQSIHYAGMLTDKDGDPLPTGEYDLAFTIYDAPEDGNIVWGPKTFTKLLVVRGRFNVILGNVFVFDTNYHLDKTYLEITINGDPPVLPRQQILSIPYAIAAGTAQGPVFVRNGEGKTVVSIGVNPDGAGFAETFGPKGKKNTAITNVPGYSNHGYVEVCNEGTTSAAMYVDPSGQGALDVKNDQGNTCASVGVTAYDAGFFKTLDSNGNLSVRIEDGVDVYDGNGTTIRTRMGSGNLNIMNDQGNAVYATVLSSGEGFIKTIGPNGNDNVRITSLSGNSDHGYVSVCDANGARKAGMYVNPSGQGQIFADVKNFSMANPLKEGTEIWYACIEGPEAAAYIRGTARLIKGMAAVQFPLHFKVVLSSKNFTVRLTPLSSESKGLAIVDKGLDGFAVRELFDGTGTYDFDYLVTGVRKNYEDYEVIRSASDLSDSDSVLKEQRGEVEKGSAQ